MEQGLVVVFGPVFDPSGAYGLGVVCVEGEEQLRLLLEKAPAATINTYEWHPMKAVIPTM